jgi:diguanylate cyclase (GGDEF)-like protein
MFDVDDFKLYNDCHGHLKGNEVLLQIAKVLLSCVREVDVVARYGGEEFAVLLPNTHKQGAYILGERIRKSVENRNFRIKDNRLLDKNLTLSGGIATYFIDAKDDQELIEKSDKALYVAKSRGKNNVTLYSTEKREHRRLTVSLGGIYTLPSSDRKSLQTVDVSVGGLSFLTTEDVPVDSIIGITLDMPVERGAGREIQLIGKVVRVKRVDDHNEVGIKIIEIEQKYKVDLMNYIKLLELQERAHSP